MRIGGARNEPVPQPRRRASDAGDARMRSAATTRDGASFLGLGEAELTPAVQGAIGTLLSEIDELRGEVARLKARLAETEGLADRDALTPALNRRALMRELGRVRAFALRYGAEASFVYFDLDDLKSLNDRLGHAAGDAALKAVAEQLAANVRDSDVVGRMGGDEFAVILVQTGVRTAQAKAEALAAQIEGALSLHVSFGVSAITEEAEPEAIVAAADAAMYARKRARRAAV